MKDNNIKNAFKAGIWYTISTLLVKSISIISTPLYTRLMSTADYGISATFNTWYALLFIICSLNVGYSIGRAKIDFKDDFDNYIGALQIICACITSILFGIIFLFFPQMKSLIGLDKTAVICLYIYVLFGTVVSIYQGKYRFLYQYKQNIVISVFISIATVIFSLLFIVILPQKYMGKIVGTTLPMLILGIMFWIVAIKNKTLSIKKEYYTYALAFSIPLIVHSLSIYVLGQSDRLMIKYFCGDHFVGIYSLIYQYAILITLITNSINQAWNPWFHDNYALKNYELIKEKVIPLIAFGCYIGIGCIAVAPEAIKILGGEQYMSGLQAVLPIALGVVIEFVYTQYVIIEMHLKKTTYVSIGTVVAAIINVLLNYLCIPRFGYIAAAYTTLVSYFMLLMMHHFISRKVLGVHIYKDKLIYAMLTITVLTGIILSNLYYHIFIRYIIIVGISVIFLVYNKEFIIDKIRRKSR